MCAVKTLAHSTEVSHLLRHPKPRSLVWKCRVLIGVFRGTATVTSHTGHKSCQTHLGLVPCLGLILTCYSFRHTQNIEHAPSFISGAAVSMASHSHSSASTISVVKVCAWQRLQLVSGTWRSWSWAVCVSIPCGTSDKTFPERIYQEALGAHNSSLPKLKQIRCWCGPVRSRVWWHWACADGPLMQNTDKTPCCCSVSHLKTL